MRIGPLCAVICIAFPIKALENIDTFGRFGTIHAYFQHERPSETVLFISGDGGWNKGVVDMALHLANMDAFVVGVDIVRYLNRLQASGEQCYYPAADFEMLSKFVQKKQGFTEYRVPIIVGYSSGATLAYALIAQAPQGTFKAALSMGFCPDLPVNKPFCKGSGLEYTPGPKGKGVNFLPRKDLPVPWIAFQGTIDEVCTPGIVEGFVKKCSNARLYLLQKVGHGFSVEKNWVPQFKEAYALISQTPLPPVVEKNLSSDTLNLPLVEVPAQQKARGVFAVIISGDGGWAGIDKAVAEALAKKGIGVVGWNSLQYFWKERSPETASNDLFRTINHYKNLWKKDTVICIGYSFGADVLPFMVTRLPQTEFEAIPLLAFLSISKTADFQFHLSDWIGGYPSKTSMPVIPELEKMKEKRMLFFFGSEEKEEIAGISTSPVGKTVSLPGGHHFGGQYDAIVDSIISELGK
jgi:type IV secretory pathway VirJ component